MTIREILYPTDFSGPARYAGQYAAMFARRLGVALHILHVPIAPPRPADVGRVDPSLSDLQKVQRRAEERLGQLVDEEEFRGLHTRTSVGGVIVEDEILRAAKETDLLVMGTHGRTGLSRIMLGSVTERVVRTAPCPVLVAKHPDVVIELPWGGTLRGTRKVPSKPRIRNILVPLDGSSLSETVLQDVREPARAFEAKIYLLMVMAPSLTVGWLPGDDARPPDRTEAENYLRAKQLELRAEGLMAEVAIHTGDAATQILDHADDRDADMIALATHGKGGLRRWLLGSVAEKVLYASDRPVLLSRAWSRST
jgi:nucleotide-binding universal stress UspA family protein